MSKWDRVSSSLLQSSHIPVLLEEKCLVRDPTLYLPLSIRSWMISLLVSYEVPAVVRIGWGRRRDINWGWKYLSEVISFSEFLTFLLRCSYQYWTMFCLSRVLNLSFVIGLLSWISGCGKAYLKHNALICANQEVSVSVILVRILLAMVFSTFPGRRHIAPKSVSCFIWSKASPGSEPAIKNINGSGFFWCSFNRFCTVSLRCWLITSVSCLLSIREAKPE